MPDTDGLTLAAKIRKRAELSATRIILLTSGDRPGDLARSREQLIVEEMREAADLIGSLDLSKATAQEKELIAKLEELKRLLLTNDLDLELKLEQLRKIREAQDSLMKLTARERQQLAQTTPLAVHARSQ